MADMNRITFDPNVAGGRAAIRGLPVTVSDVINRLAEGKSVEQVLAELPALEQEDILHALRYLAKLASADAG